MSECIIVTCGCQFSSFTIGRDSFREAVLDTVTGTTASEVLDLLFTMWDIQGNHFIQYREFLVGVSPLASSQNDTLSTALRYSLHLMDTANTGRTTQSNLLKVLMAINTTASYVGDHVLRPNEVQEIVRHVFGRNTSLSRTMSHNDIVPRLVMHPKIDKFMSGCGSLRYRPPSEELTRQSKRRRRTGGNTLLYEC